MCVKMQSIVKSLLHLPPSATNLTWVVCAVTPFIYFRQYNSISRKLPRGYSHDIQFMALSLVALNIWNLVLATSDKSIILNLRLLVEFLDTNEDISLINEENSSPVNKFYFFKDIKLVIIICISIFLTNAYSIGILRCLEYISFISNDFNESEVEKVPRTNGHRKSVSFDENLITYTYQIKNISNENLPGEVNQSKLATLPGFTTAHLIRIFKRYSFLFIQSFILLVILLPKNFMLNSSAILYELDSNFVIRSDHVMLALISAFGFDCLFKVFRGMTCPNIHYQLKCFPQSLLVLSKFVWSYNCFILVMSLAFMIMFNDVLINVVTTLVTDITAEDKPYQSYPVQFFTSILINYLSHSSIVVEASCEDTFAQCIQPSSLEAVNLAFQSLYLSIVNCWNILNLFSFTLLPMVIWFVFEVKLRMWAKSKGQQTSMSV